MGTRTPQISLGDRQTEKQTDRDTDRQTDTQRDKQTDRQGRTDRPTGLRTPKYISKKNFVNFTSSVNQSAQIKEFQTISVTVALRVCRK